MSLIQSAFSIYLTYIGWQPVLETVPLTLGTLEHAQREKSYMTLPAPIQFVRLPPQTIPTVQEQTIDDSRQLPASPGRITEVYETVDASHSSQSVERLIKNASQTILTPAQETSQIIAQALRKKFKLQLNPDHTYIVTTNYDTTKPAPSDGKILNQISLTEAALTNVRRKNNDDESPTGLARTHPTASRLLNIFHSFPLVSVIQMAHDFMSPTYEYVVRGTGTSKDSVPNLSSKVSLTPQQFRDLVWETELITPYKSYLDTFWATHEKPYELLTKIALVQAALAQQKDGSLSNEETRLVLRASGLQPGKPWSETSVKNLEAPYAKDPDVDVGLLSINGDVSTDLLYIIDKKTRLDSHGKPIKTTLLHIPGNSSPLHRFDNPEAMKTWLADQAADPIKRTALLNHFTKNDQDDKFFSDGVKQSLVGLGGWTEAQKPNALGFTSLSDWDSQRYITLEPLNGDPFKAMTQRQKERAYADADHDITTDGDVIKDAALKLAEAATATALLLTPLAFVMPEVGLALDAIYTGAGITEVGVGIDDLAHGKSRGTDRIVFGVLNAVPGIAGSASKLDRGTASIESAVADEAIEAPNSPPTEDVTTPAPTEAANRLRPSESNNISAHAVEDGERLIEHATKNANNIYHLREADGLDRWFIRHTDHSEIERVYELKSNFKLTDQYAEIIDPTSRQSIMTVHLDKEGIWVQLDKGAGINFPWNASNSSAKAQLAQDISRIDKDENALSSAERERVLDELTRLTQTSRAEDYESLNEYTEAGSGEINEILRTEVDPNKYPPNVSEFLSDLDEQAEYSGKAYRYAFVTSEGADKLKNGVGRVFRDSGIQSASTQAFNAKGWATWAKDTLPVKNRQPVIYIFDESIAKKNLSSSILPDHVAIEPQASLEVSAAKIKDGILYVSFKAPAKLPDQRYNLFDGRVAFPY
jgi:hypothetical protein